MHRARVGLVSQLDGEIFPIRKRYTHAVNRIVRIHNKTHGLNLGLGYHMQAGVVRNHTNVLGTISLRWLGKRKYKRSKKYKKMQWKYNTYIFSDDYFAI